MRMLMRTDPFREMDRLTQQLLGVPGTHARPSVMAMDAWRDGEQFYAEFDLPGIDPDTVDLQVERNELTIRAERPVPEREGQEVLASEQPRGVFTRQLILGDGVDAERIEANYHAGVLSLRIPFAEAAKPRKISIGTAAPEARKSISAA
jgi:HSP20 family protein